MPNFNLKRFFHLRDLVPKVVLVAKLSVGILVAGCFLWSCGRAQTSTPKPEDTITFSVGACGTSRQLEGVEVLLVRKDGQLENLGQTDIAGHLTVKKGVIAPKGSAVVLFCKEKYFCGALRLDEADLLAARLRLIHLAQFALP